MTTTPPPWFARQLTWHIAILCALGMLPLVGLVVYFLMTGLHREIAVAEREHRALQHMTETVDVLEKAVEFVWTETGNDTELITALDRQVASLRKLHASMNQTPGLSPLPQPAQDSRSTEELEVQLLWENLREAEQGSQQRSEALRKLAEQLHENMFRATDEFGLGSGPEGEISALTDVVVVGCPQHVERVLHMHERMARDLRERGWDAETIAAADIFAHQIAEDDLERIKQGIDAALRADAQSAKQLLGFQQHFPKQAQDLLSEMHGLARAIRPAGPGQPPPMDPEHFDLLLKQDFHATMEGWKASIEHLDNLIRDQIHVAETNRNKALGLAALVAALFIPASMLYFRGYIRPVLREMSSENARVQQVAAAASAAADVSGRRLKDIQRALDDHCGVFVTDLEGRILSVNERFLSMLGHTREEMVGRLAMETVQDPDPAVFTAIEEALVGGGIWRGNLCRKAKDGRSVWVDLTVFPSVDDTGTLNAVFAIETDITDLVNARKTAEAATLAKSQFLAMMSHEIRTPMNGVIGFGNLLAETPLDEAQSEYVRTIVTSGEALLVIINDILDISKLEADRTELEPRPVALRLLVEDVLDLLASQARAKNTELVYWCTAQVPEGIVVDENRLRQVLLNLVGNAVKFTQGGHVEVEVSLGVEAGRRMLRFNVRDTGIGIPPERVATLFEPFTQVDASITRRFGGTGLGLAISKRLVQLMGGRIEVWSMAGQGSDFLFTLPAIEADVAGQIESRAPVENLEQCLRGKRVLVVDDLPANQRLVEGILTRYGVRTESVGNAEEAMWKVRAHSFDLAVLDYVMPGETGLTLAKRIRELASADGLPLILLASTPPPKGELEPGLFESVIAKPIRNQQFAMDVARAMNRGRDGLPDGKARKVLAETAAAPLAEDHPLKILVVDDNPLNLKVISALLKTMGYVPALYDQPVEALDELSEHKYDLVLMDVQMPELNGHEATRRIRSGCTGELNRQTRIIALTAGAMLEERSACLAAGMDDFLSKPVRRGELEAKLASMETVR